MGAMVFPIVRLKAGSGLLESVRADVLPEVEWWAAKRRPLQCVLEDLALTGHAYRASSHYSQSYTITTHLRPTEVGYVKSDRATLGDDPFVGYLLGALVDGQTFEVLVTREVPGTAVFCWNGRSLGTCTCRPERAILASRGFKGYFDLELSNQPFGRVGSRCWGVTATSLAIVHRKPDSLPVAIASPQSESFLEFAKSILKLVTLYPLWSPGWTKSNENRVMPYGVYSLEQPDEIRFYFAVNLFFRMLIFDRDASAE